MPRTLVNSDIIEVIHYCRDAEQVSQNVWHAKVAASGVITATDADVAKYLANLAAAPFAGVMSPHSEFYGSSCRVINVVPLPMMEGNTEYTTDGTLGTDPLPRQTSGIISWKTPMAGPGHRGRTYLPFPPVEADNSDGRPSAAYLTAAATVANQGIFTVSVEVSGRVATFTWGLWKRATATFIPYTGFSNPVRWATQRSRGSYGRANQVPF